MDNKDQKKIMDIIKNADMQKVGGYIQMFDRILLYVLAKNQLPSNVLQDTVDLWMNAAKRGINIDASSRTEFLQTTPNGRIAKLNKEPDGESVRLYNIEQLKIAEQLILANMAKDEDTGESFDVDA